MDINELFGREVKAKALAPKDLSMFTRQLEMLLNTGIPMLDALNALEEAAVSENLKKVGISIAVFLFIVIISYVLSEGVETPMKDGKILPAFSSRIVETGIRTFYFLVVIALGLMLFSGLKKRLVK